jgi:hypothetical protein|tara:strand:- start:30 stop:221 length:192 start_codon:yes stop_codon:yes gene_type:complete
MVLAQKEVTAAQEPAHILRGLQQLLQVTEVFTVAAAGDQDTNPLEVRVLEAQAVVGKAVLTLM